jgi:hypothetical protein
MLQTKVDGSTNIFDYVTNYDTPLGWSDLKEEMSNIIETCQ